MDTTLIASVAPSVWHRAIEVFDSEAKAALWFRTPVAELGERTPEEVVSRGGADEVMAILDRIDFVVYG